jgi:hypothetical protein
MEAGVAVTVVVATPVPFWPCETPGRAIIVNNKAEKRCPRIRPLTRFWIAWIA